MFIWLSTDYGPPKKARMTKHLIYDRFNSVWISSGSKCDWSILLNVLFPIMMLKNKTIMMLVLSDAIRKSKKKCRAPVSMSASYTSTKGEELVALICTLHAEDNWNPYFNHYISTYLNKIATLLANTPTTNNVSSLLIACVHVCGHVLAGWIWTYHISSIKCPPL